VLLVQTQEATFVLARTLSDRRRRRLPSPQAGSPRSRGPGVNRTKLPETALALDGLRRLMQLVVRIPHQLVDRLSIYGIHGNPGLELQR
jgi:hypothetical protein